MTSHLDLPLTRIDGKPDTLRAHLGNVLLIVNVASKCGLTPQYAGLEALYRTSRARGFEILGFPSNDFAGQEPGTDAEIAAYCSASWDVDFPLFAKTPVLGPDRHPLYAALTAARPEATGEGPMRERLKGYGVVRSDPAEILWNFEKFLLGRSGDVVERFAPDVAADDPRLLASIETALAA